MCFQLMSDPLVSVLVNNYNYGRFLAAAINSALGQDYPLPEVVVGRITKTFLEHVLDSKPMMVLAVLSMVGCRRREPHSKRPFS